MDRLNEYNAVKYIVWSKQDLEDKTQELLLAKDRYGARDMPEKFQIWDTIMYFLDEGDFKEKMLLWELESVYQSARIKSYFDLSRARKDLKDIEDRINKFLFDVVEDINEAHSKAVFRIGVKKFPKLDELFESSKELWDEDEYNKLLSEYNSAKEWVKDLEMAHGIFKSIDKYLYRLGFDALYRIYGEVLKHIRKTEGKERLIELFDAIDIDYMIGKEGPLDKVQFTYKDEEVIKYAIVLEDFFEGDGEGEDEDENDSEN